MRIAISAWNFRSQTSQDLYKSADKSLEAHYSIEAGQK